MTAPQALGTEYGLRFQNETGRFEVQKLSRFKLRRQAAEIIQSVRFNHRMVDCHARVQKGAGGVDVRVANGKSWFRGQWQCGCVWVCPVCAPRIAESRRREMQAGLDYHLGVGGGVSLLTLTQRHTSTEPLESSLVRYAKSLKSLKSGRAYEALRKRFGLIGEIRTLEVTFGRNGWHVHTHSILITRTPIEGDQLEQLKDAFFVLWFQACGKHGAELPSHKHGVDVKAARYVADYVAKWGFAEELTKGHLKKGWDGGRTPWELLAAAAEGDRMATSLWIEFADCFEDRRQLLWSPGLRKKLGLSEEMITDQEAMVLEPSDAPPVTVVTIDEYTYFCLVREQAFDAVLDAALESRESLFGVLNGLRLSGSREWLEPLGVKEEWQQ